MAFSELIALAELRPIHARSAGEAERQIHVTAAAPLPLARVAALKSRRRCGCVLGSGSHKRTRISSGPVDPLAKLEVAAA